MKKKDPIIRNRLCMGCGLCASVAEEQFAMRLSDAGFYEPDTSASVSKDPVLRRVCPGVHIQADETGLLWGRVEKLHEAWSADESIRFHSSSGGVVTTLAVWLLETKQVDAVMQVGQKEGSSVLNELQVSRTREDVIKRAQSRYAPALSLYGVKQLLDTTNDRFAFIGKPCDITGIRNLVRCFPQYKDRFKLLISIFCAGIPSLNATLDICRRSGHDELPVSLKYRGDGWPGNFRAEWKDGKVVEMSYQDSWGNVLGRKVNYRCKICPDGIGLQADIVVGDSWSTADGYPLFSDEPGRSFVMARTREGVLAFDGLCSSGRIESHPLNEDKIAAMQPFQYRRRRMAGWRLLPIRLFHCGLIRFKGLHLARLSRDVSLLTGIREMLGSTKRMLKNG